MRQTTHRIYLLAKAGRPGRREAYVVERDTIGPLVHEAGEGTPPRLDANSVSTLLDQRRIQGCSGSTELKRFGSREVLRTRFGEEFRAIKRGEMSACNSRAPGRINEVDILKSPTNFPGRYLLHRNGKLGTQPMPSILAIIIHSDLSSRYLTTVFPIVLRSYKFSKSRPIKYRILAISHQNKP